MSELTDLTLRAAADRLAAGEISSVELTLATLAQIELTEPVVHAYAAVTADSALAAAEQADRELASATGWRGPLHGIPVGIKDIIFTTEAPTESGSRTMTGYRPDHDATVVSRLRDAGAVIVGKTHTHEFAYGQSEPPSRNVWDAERISGGSSAGSGAAVGARSAFATIGTDGGGSIRGPAAFQGIVGLKPTCGRVSRHGVIPMSASLDHVGPLTRTVEDCALVMNVIAGFDPLDPQSWDVPVPDYLAGLNGGLKGVRLGIERHHFCSDPPPEYLAAVDAAAAELEALGAELVEIRIPELELVDGIFLNLIATDTSGYHRRLLRDKPDGYDPRTRIMLEFGELLFGTDYLVAQKARRVLYDATRSAFAKHRLDGLFAPSNAGTAPLVSEHSGNLFARPHRMSVANILGLPAMNVPCGFSSDGLPFGFQVYGRPFGEPTLFRVGGAYQMVTEWHLRSPAVAERRPSLVEQ